MHPYGELRVQASMGRNGSDDKALMGRNGSDEASMCKASLGGSEHLAVHTDRTSGATASGRLDSGSHGYNCIIVAPM